MDENTCCYFLPLFLKEWVFFSKAIVIFEIIVTLITERQFCFAFVKKTGYDIENDGILSRLFF